MENTYDNNEGGSTQQNAAHLVEFLGATAIVDFSQRTKFDNPENMELGIKETSGPVSFDSFYRKMHEMLYYPLVQFTMTANALTQKANLYRSNNFNAHKSHFQNMSSGFFEDLVDFLEKYRTWLKEMKDNKHSLDLFNLDCGNKPFELVTGKKPKRILSKFSDYNLMTDRLNCAVKNCKSKGTEDKFLEMFFLGTEKLVSEKLSN